MTTIAGTMMWAPMRLRRRLLCGWGESERQGWRQVDFWRFAQLVQTHGQFPDDVENVRRRHTRQVLPRSEMKVLCEACYFGAANGKNLGSACASTIRMNGAPHLLSTDRDHMRPSRIPVSFIQEKPASRAHMFERLWIERAGQRQVALAGTG